MIRFRNPISDMSVLILNFKKMYIDFSNMEYFTLDHIAEFFAREKLASSSGYTGDEALKRSYAIKDDSKKSMKMQAKSYTEIYRALGWLTSNERALFFNFSYLGIHVALSGDNAKSIFEQCLLGISYPNNILNVKFTDINKPFVNILLFANELDGKIHRDEILLGPMNLKNGFSATEVTEKICLIKKIRETKKIKNLNNAIDDLAADNHMKTNSVRNLTRFVISALEYTGWFIKEKQNIYGNNSVFLILTPKGKEIVNIINNSVNINGNDLNINDVSVSEISELAFLTMLDNAGFDVSEEILNFEQKKKYFDEKSILFSPYQFFSKEQLEIVLPEHIVSQGKETRDMNLNGENNVYSLKREFSITSKKSSLSKNEKISKDILKLLSENNNNQILATESFLNNIKTMKQTEFYPLVANLMGFIFNKNSFAPQAGNNNLRYDVIIEDQNFSIPVEVKSPTEEEMLSVKAIRQAVENKVLLLSRKPYPTTYDMSSFACGYKLPNDRSDVYKLINEIYDIYNINIAVIDMKILINAAIHCAKNKSFFDIEDFRNQRGVVNFEN